MIFWQYYLVFTVCGIICMHQHRHSCLHLRIVWVRIYCFYLIFVYLKVRKFLSCMIHVRLNEIIVLYQGFNWLILNDSWKNQGEILVFHEFFLSCFLAFPESKNSSSSTLKHALVNNNKELIIESRIMRLS